MNGENKRRFMGEDLLKQFQFSLMSPTEFSDEVSLVMPTDILFLTEVVDVFKRFTSVSIPGGFKFSLSPRKTADEPLSSFNTGEGQVPDQEASGATSDVSNKTGMFTFAVKRDTTLTGVFIVTGKGQESCQVCLSITERGKKIKQIKSKTFMQKETLDSDSHGEVNVVFNRPVNLLKNTCYTIETETETTNNRYCGFVRSAKTTTVSRAATAPSRGVSFGTPAGFGGFWAMQNVSLQPVNSSSSQKIDQENVVSCYSFGKCPQKCPDHSEYSGEIMQLLFKG